MIQTVLYSVCAENIVLIGFMGSGKSTIGRMLSFHTDRFFLDADSLIETMESKDISSIFDENGEEYFRDLERKSAKWMAKCVRKAVISTGGGMPQFADNLRSIGKVVYLKLPFDAIMKRINETERKKRPLFSDINKAKELFDIRSKLYQNQAQITINADREASEIVEEIIAQSL